MPWHIDNDNPDCSGFAVVLDATGEVVGCHDTKEEALAQLAALNINVKEQAMDEAQTPRAAEPPRDNLIRAQAGGFKLEEIPGAAPILHGHAAVFNQWTKIDSAIEGTFLERILPGAFRRTINNNVANMRILFNHGQDPELGDKVLAPIESLAEDKTGLAYSGHLLEGVPPLVVSGLRAGVYGSSFRFSVMKQDFNRNAVKSDFNPDGLPERTIEEARVMEFGPVTFPAYPGASAGVRSLTDRFVLNRLVADPERLGELVESITEPDPQPKSEPDTADPAPATPPQDPAPATPERVAPSPPGPPPRTAPNQDPPNGGSSDTRRTKVADLSPEDRASRMTELESAIRGVAESYTGALPNDVEVTYQNNKQELADLARDEAAYAQRKADIERLAEMVPPAAVTTRVENPWGVNAPNVIKKPENIYGGAAFDDIEKRGRNSQERNQLRRDFAMRGVEKTSFASIADTQQSRDRIAKLIDEKDEPTVANPDHELARRIIATGDPVYKRAWSKLCQTGGRTDTLGTEERVALAMSVTTTGGFLVPYAFDPTIIAIGVHNIINPYRRTCRVIDVVGSNIWHGLTSTAVTAVRGVEALVAAEAAPTLAQPSITPSRVETQVTYSIEVAQDRPDIGDELAILIQEAKDNEEEASFSVGTGATTMLNCVGMVAPKSTSGGWTLSETAANNAVTAADLQKFELALPVRFRMNAQWFLGRKTIRYIQALETAYGQLFNAAGMYPSPGYPAVGNPELNAWGNTGLKLLGYPVNESASIPTTLTSALAWGAFCDPKTFVIVDRVGMDVEFIPTIFGSGQGNMATGQRALYAYWRNACAPVTILGGLNLTMLT